MADTTKDTIYIDIDDEITGIIDKLRGSKHKIVALVLPKRAAVLQSVVNMKLLKRSAEEENKKLVLITSEASLMPLAGVVGVHVAKTLQSKPAIPPTPDAADAPETLIDQGPEGDEGEIDSSKSVGELSGLPEEKPPEEDIIDVDNTEEDETDKKTDKDKDKKSKSKKPKIPNFNKFRIRLVLSVLLIILLVAGIVAANVILPKAVINITTNSSQINASISFTADTSAKSLDLKKSVIPAKLEQVDKSDSVTVAASGQKNVGNKAAGTMSVTNCSKNTGQYTVPSGTAFTSGQFTFVTTESVTLEQAVFDGSGNCLTSLGSTLGFTKDAAAEASQGGTSYNIDSRAYNSSLSGITGYGSKMTGGTDKNVTVVAQADIDKAKGQLKSQSQDSASTDLVKKLQDDKLFALKQTIIAGKQTVSSIPKLGDQSSDVTVTATTTYTMLGVKEDYLKNVIDNSIKDQVNKQSQAISDYGFETANVSLDSKRSATNQSLSMTTTVIAGAKIDQEALKQQITGMKSGPVHDLIKSRPGVTDVNVSYSPFWITKAPKPDRVTINITNQGAGSGSN